MTLHPRNFLAAQVDKDFIERSLDDSEKVQVQDITFLEQNGKFA